MKTIKYLGGIHALNGNEEDVYSGLHDGKLINLAVGDEADIADESAQQIAADFPGCFEIDGKTIGERPKLELVPDEGDGQPTIDEVLATEALATADDENVQPAPEPKPEPAPVDEDLAGQLMAHMRADLNAAAKKLKIKDADKLPNKQAVVDAIVAAKKAS